MSATLLKSVTYMMIEEAQQRLDGLKRLYLERFGWKETCQTPGSFWLWRRDFAAEDAVQKAWDEKHGLGKPGRALASAPYGVVTVPVDLAVSMTLACLDEQPEREED